MTLVRDVVRTLTRSTVRHLTRLGGGIPRLFSGGAKGVWIDPSDLSTMFQDAAGTVPVTEPGQPVGLILDKSGNGIHFSQSSSGSRPTLRKDDHGRYYLEFDGSNDLVSSASVDLGDVVSLFALARVESTDGTNQVLFQMGGDVERPSIRLHFDTDSKWSATLLGSSGTNRWQSEAYEPPFEALISAVVDTTAEQGIDVWPVYRINGDDARDTDVASVAVAGPLSGALHLGARASATQTFNGRLYGFVAVEGDASLSDIRAVESQLGPPIQPPPPAIEVGTPAVLGYSTLEEAGHQDVTVEIPEGCAGLLIAVSTGSSAEDTEQDYVTATLDPGGEAEVSVYEPLVRTGTYNIAKFLMIEADDLPDPGEYTLRFTHTNVDGITAYIVAAALPLICPVPLVVRQTDAEPGTATTSVTSTFDAEVDSGSLVAQVVSGGDHNRTISFVGLANTLIVADDPAAGGNSAGIAYEIDPEERQAFQVTSNTTQNRLVVAAIEIAMAAEE